MGAPFFYQKVIANRKLPSYFCPLDSLIIKNRTNSMIAVLGGGISGLAAAYQLQEKGIEFVLLEASNQLGGKIQSRQKDGFTLELGPNTVLINNSEINQLIKDLGLENEIILPEEKAVKSRFILKNGKIEALPSSFSTAIKSKLFGFGTLYRILTEPFRKKSTSTEDESLADFSRRRFGKQIYQDFVNPFVTGIYAGDPEKMSVRNTLSSLKEAEENHGSVLKGMLKMMRERKEDKDFQTLPKQKIFTFKEGLVRLVNELAKKVQTNVQLSAKVESITYDEDLKKYQISYLKDNQLQQLEVEQIISALPATVLAAQVKQLAPKLSSKLEQITYVPAVTLSLTCNSNDMSFKADAFGLLSRKNEAVPFLGVLFNSRFFPHYALKGKELMTVICGGYHRPDLLAKTDEEIHQIIDDSIRPLFGISTPTTLLNIQKWPKGIPQYEIGHDEIMKTITEFENQHQNFSIIGNFRNGISVSDCIKNGIKCAKSLEE